MSRGNSKGRSEHRSVWCIMDVDGVHWLPAFMHMSLISHTQIISRMLLAWTLLSFPTSGPQKSLFLVVNPLEQEGSTRGLDGLSVPEESLISGLGIGIFRCRFCFCCYCVSLDMLLLGRTSFTRSL